MTKRIKARGRITNPISYDWEISYAFDNLFFRVQPVNDPLPESEEESRSMMRQAARRLNLDLEVEG